MSGFLGDKAEKVVKNIMEDYGIEPGELYRTIDETMEVLNQLAPQVENMEEISENLDGDIQEFREEVRRFNDNTEELTEALNNTASTLEKFGEMMQNLEEDN